MPGMPIFQDSPSQLKGQIYVIDSTNDNVVPLKVDNTGNLPVNFATGAEVSLSNGTEVGLSTGATVALAANSEVGLSTGATVALAANSEVGLSTGAEVALTAGGIVGLSAGTNLIGKVENQLVFTNLDSFGGATPLTTKTITATTDENATAQDISLESSYNWFIKNNGTAANQNITLKVEISPDNSTWLDDTGTTISVKFGTSKMITVTNFLKYARFVATGGAADTTVISSFQAQH